MYLYIVTDIDLIGPELIVLLPAMVETTDIRNHIRSITDVGHS